MSLKLYACCLCFPLRIGLLVWGYFGLAMSYISIVHAICRISDFLDGSEESDSGSFVNLSLTTGALGMHLVFYIVLIAGLHKRSGTLLEIFYGYCVIVMIIWATVQALYIPLKAYKLRATNTIHVWGIVLIHVVMAAVGLLLQSYLAICVRSMISTLEEQIECLVPLDEIEDQACVLHMYSQNPEFFSEVSNQLK